MKIFYDRALLEAGCDEAGRGCLAGPVFAAAVILPKSFRHPFLTDSKLLSAEKRYYLRDFIKRKALAWAVAEVDNSQIDEVNILRASIMAMHKALDRLKVTPELILVDGNKFLPYQQIPHKCVVRGDSIYMSIAAASILAKTYRDDHMNVLHEKHPQYLWNKNKGYPTSEHREGIIASGVSPYHRKSFRLLKPNPDVQIEMGF